MTAALNAENKLDSMAASVGAGLHGDKAAQVLSRLASRDAQRKAQVEQQSADQRYTSIRHTYCHQHSCVYQTGTLSLQGLSGTL